MLHPGHLGLFKWCNELAGSRTGTVTVAVNTSEFVTAFKTAPRYTSEERLLMVSSIKGVDEVVLNDGKNQAELILASAPHLIVIGSDWARKDYLAQLGISQDWLDDNGIGLVYVPRTGEWSSTEMRARGK